MKTQFFVVLTIVAIALKIVGSGLDHLAGFIESGLHTSFSSLCTAFLALAAGLSLLAKPLHPLAAAAALSYQLFLVVVTFPYTLNHVALELWLLMGALGFLLLQRSSQLPAFFGSSYLFVLFWSGVQKLAGGSYHSAEFFESVAASGGSLMAEFLTAAHDHFGTHAAPALSWLTVATEIAFPLLWVSSERLSRWVAPVFPLFQACVAVISEEWSFGLVALPLSLVLATVPRAHVIRLLNPFSRVPTGRWLGSPMAALARFLCAVSLFMVAVWPVFHLVLSQSLGVNPWRLFGWGMYAVQDRPGKMQVELRLRAASEHLLRSLVRADSWHQLAEYEHPATDHELILSVTLLGQAPESDGEDGKKHILVGSQILPERLVSICSRVLIDFPLAFLKKRCSEQVSGYLNAAWPGLDFVGLSINGSRRVPPDHVTDDETERPCIENDTVSTRLHLAQLQFEGSWNINGSGKISEDSSTPLRFSREFVSSTHLNAIALWSLSKGTILSEEAVAQTLPGVPTGTSVSDLLKNETLLPPRLNDIGRALGRQADLQNNVRLDQVLRAIQESPAAPSPGHSDLAAAVFLEFAERRSHKTMEDLWAEYRQTPVQFSRTVAVPKSRNTDILAEADPVAALRLVLNQHADSLPALSRQTGFRSGFGYRSGRPFSDSTFWNDGLSADEAYRMIWAYDSGSDALVALQSQQHTAKQLRRLAVDLLACADR